MLPSVVVHYLFVYIHHPHKATDKKTAKTKTIDIKTADTMAAKEMNTMPLLARHDPLGHDTR